MSSKSAEIVLLGFSADASESIRRELSPLTQGSALTFRSLETLDPLAESSAARPLRIVVANDRPGGLDVRRVVARCRQQAGGPPVIVVLANGQAEFASRSLACAADDYVFWDRLYCLRWVVQRHLDQRQWVAAPAPLCAASAAQIGGRLSGLLEVSTDAIIAADRDFSIIFFNKGAERSFGYLADEMIGLPFTLLIPSFADDVTRFRRTRPADEGGGGVGECGELAAYRKDGSAFPAEVSLAVLDEDGGAVYLAILRDVGEKKRVAEQVEYLATHDSLTGLPNRRLFFDRLSRAIDAAERDESLMALMFIDLDGFKQINDVLGHAAGDELLHVVAQRIRGQLRAADTVARLGGDEFAVIIEHLMHVDPISELASALLRALAEPIPIGRATARVSASIGIVICPLETKSSKQMMVDADRAMYAAKAAGKGRYLFYCADMATAPELGDEASPATAPSMTFQCA